MIWGSLQWYYNCLNNAAQEDCTNPNNNKPVNSGNIQEENFLDAPRKLRLVKVKKSK